MNDFMLEFKWNSLLNLKVVVWWDGEDLRGYDNHHSTCCISCWPYSECLWLLLLLWKSVSGGRQALLTCLRSTGNRESNRGIYLCKHVVELIAANVWDLGASPIKSSLRGNLLGRGIFSANRWEIFKIIKRVLGKLKLTKLYIHKFQRWPHGSRRLMLIHSESNSKQA